MLLPLKEIYLKHKAAAFTDGFMAVERYTLEMIR